MTQHSAAGRRFRTPPGWPPAPEGWTPPHGWAPPAHWPAPPEDWRFWDEPAGSGGVLALPATASGATASGATARGATDAAPTRRERRRVERESEPEPPDSVLPPRAYVPLEPLAEIDVRALGRKAGIERLEADRRAWHDRAEELNRRLHERDAQVELLGAMSVVEREARGAELADEVAEWASALDVVRAEVAAARAELEGLGGAGRERSAVR
ncbi:hypothetical protein QT381_12635 [Galbitalea sp. SE-J8]|uniref:hypothetical protein n=1 Tax=Galbitalea sp. SE-J8 TaxID=3054952 RepID=UPI00259CB95E|nr:hypothetical protein [Galbitalea sp. SE-J8]MDM4763855.1 hypothetical protein [Galbitalea sp. SE-J8]